jgi:hypothetical protein
MSFVPIAPVAPGEPAVSSWANNVRGNLNWLHDNTMVRLGTVSLSTNTSTIEFTGIPTGSAFRQLYLFGHARSSIASDFTSLNLRINGDVGTNYYGQEVVNTNGTVTGATRLASSFIRVCPMPGNTATPTQSFGNFEARIFDPGVTSRHATVQVSGGGSSGGSSLQDSRGVARWNNNAAVTSILLYVAGSGTDLRAGTVATLYGVR